VSDKRVIAIVCLVKTMTVTSQGEQQGSDVEVKQLQLDGDTEPRSCLLSNDQVPLWYSPRRNSVGLRDIGTEKAYVPRTPQSSPQQPRQDKRQDTVDQLSDDAESSSESFSGLLSNSQVPPWYSQTYIHTGYRPVKHSIRFCFGSLGSLHNETVNIYSHLLPAVLAVILSCLVSLYFRSNFPNATRSDRLIFEIYLVTSTACFTVSSLYYTLLCHSRYCFDLWVRIDYVAILFQILGSFVSGIYIGFYCEPNLQKLYWSMVSLMHLLEKLMSSIANLVRQIGTLALLNTVVVIHPKLQSPKWRLLRTGSFIATGLSAFAPIVHAAAIFPYSQLDKQAGLQYYYIEGALVILGAVHFAVSGFIPITSGRRILTST